MLIVISNPEPLADEAALINSLFEAGLQRFHLRKPDASTDDVARLLEAIDPQYHAHIALHDPHHQLADAFGIKRLHFGEAARKKPGGSEAQTGAYTLSTSMHAIASYEALPAEYAYSFLSPVFDSISKPGYGAMDESERSLWHIKKGPQLIALGGITRQNCHLPFEWGFDGVAVLGALWQDTTQLTNNFKTLQAACVPAVR